MKRKENMGGTSTHTKQLQPPSPLILPAAIVWAKEYDLFGVTALSRVGLIGGEDMGARRLPEALLQEHRWEMRSLEVPLLLHSQEVETLPFSAITPAFLVIVINNQ